MDKQQQTPGEEEEEPAGALDLSRDPNHGKSVSGQGASHPRATRKGCVTGTSPTAGSSTLKLSLVNYDPLTLVQMPDVVTESPRTPEPQTAS